MGLDVTAYGSAVLLPEHEWDADNCWEAGHVRAFAYVGFEQSLRGLVWTEQEPDLSGKPAVFVGGREYLCDGETDSLSISYGGHRIFRERLAAALNTSTEAIWADPDRYREMPFFELINFADNEGTIGPEAAADLAFDFGEHRDSMRTVLAQPPHDWMVKKYDDWHRCFLLAAGHGLVQFH